MCARDFVRLLSSGGGGDFDKLGSFWCQPAKPATQTPTMYDVLCKGRRLFGEKQTHSTMWWEFVGMCRPQGFEVESSVDVAAMVGSVRSLFSKRMTRRRVTMPQKRRQTIKILARGQESAETKPVERCIEMQSLVSASLSGAAAKNLRWLSSIPVIFTAD